MSSSPNKLTRLDFLNTVLPQGGVYCVVALQKGKAQQTFLSTLEEVDHWAEAQPPQGKDTYFSPASYNEKAGRFAKNTKGFRSLYIDLDIGKGTDFLTQYDGLIALKNFSGALQLPTPTIVSSGYGLHIYWTFCEAVGYDTWKPLAVALVERMMSEGFKVKDKGLTTDAVRILRLPDTTNFKGGLEADVTVLKLSPSKPIELFKALLNTGDVLSPKPETISANIVLSNQVATQNTNIFLEQELLNIINNSFKKSLKEEVRHDTRLKIGHLVGGCISGGWAREEVLLPALAAASDSVAQGGITNSSELKTLKDGIVAGKKKPMTEEDFKKYNGLSGDVFGDVVALGETDNTLYTTDVRDGTASTRPLTEYGNAQRLSDSYSKDVLYVAGASCFLHWNNNWQWDSEGSMTRSLAADLYKIIYREGERFPQQGPVFAAWSRTSQSEKTIKATVSLYKDIPENRLPLQIIDGNQFMVGLDNARQIINLKTGEIRPAKRSDYITKSLNIREVGQAAKAQRWLQFLFEVFGNDPELIGWLQRLCGYILTGSTKEQFFLFCYGLGANGKSVLLDILRFILGDYARAIASETLTDSKRAAGSASPDLADLIGARLALTTELEEGIALAESLIKALTGGDALSARKLYSAPTQFTPQFKIIMSGNHKPLIKGKDHGIWRRVRLLPFTRTFSEEERDPNLSEKLRVEAPHILAWMVEGCLAWQEKGLADIPATIKSATADYKEDQDLIGAWLADCCQLSSQHESLSNTLYNNYTLWCATNGLMKSSNKVFGRRLIERGFTSRKSNGKQFWTGVEIIPNVFTV